jgi:hypothetical protein
MTYYILDKDNNPVEANSVKYEIFMSDRGACTVKEDDIGQAFRVSTHFLPTGHPSNQVSPLFFETMIFDLQTGTEARKEDVGEMSTCYRTGTWDNAVALHNRVLLGLANALLSEILEEEAFTVCET